MGKFQTWEEFEKELNILPEEEEEIRLEMELIEATIKARKAQKLSQEELSKRSGLKQSAIARVERGTSYGIYIKSCTFKKIFKN